MSRSKASKSKPGRPRSEDVAAIENRLLAAALQEFLDRGYGGASLSRIVREAGVSKTTLYSRFASKEQLFRAIMFRQHDRLAPAALLTLDDAPPNLSHGLCNYANRMLEQSLGGEMLGINRLIYSESHRFPELGAAAAERTGLGVTRIASFIEECALRDGVPCRDPAAVAEVFILTIRGWYVNVMLTNRRISARRRQAWVDNTVRILLSSREHW